MWGHTDSNREPSSYEPPALTVELCPLKMTIGHFKEKMTARLTDDNYCRFYLGSKLRRRATGIHSN